MSRVEGYPQVMLDFDGTIARTTDEFPVDGVDIGGAYEMAVESVFDLSTMERFIVEGGHKNRTPLEIVTALRPDLSTDRRRQKAQNLTQEKLEILLSQIGHPVASGEPWPRPTDGFIEFWRLLTELRKHDPVARAVISAGHTEFIGRTFDLFDIERPDVTVSAEVIDGLGLGIPLDLQVKPAPLPIRIAESALQTVYRGQQPGALLYAGDSAEKDGGLAANVGAKFTLIDTTNAGPGWRRIGGQVNAIFEDEVVSWD